MRGMRKGGAHNTAYAQRRARAIREFRQMRRQTVRELRQAGVTQINRRMQRKFERQALNRLQTSLGVQFTQREVGELNRRIGRAVARYNDGGFRRDKRRGGGGMGRGGRYERGGRGFNNRNVNRNVNNTASPIRS
jgi:hypothetical protein